MRSSLRLRAKYFLSRRRIHRIAVRRLARDDQAGGDDQHRARERRQRHRLAKEIPAEEHRPEEAGIFGGREDLRFGAGVGPAQKQQRSEEHTSELQSLMRISYAVLGLKKKKK